MDWAKEIFDTYSSRIKSPIAGSILTTLIVVNWKSVFYVLFSGKDVVEKFTYWEANTSWISIFFIPLIVGVLIAGLLPWISYWGTELAFAPTNRKNLLKEKSEHEKLLVRLTFENEREQAALKLKETILAQATTEDKLSSIENEDVREKFKKEIANIDNNSSIKPEDMNHLNELMFRFKRLKEDLDESYHNGTKLQTQIIEDEMDRLNAIIQGIEKSATRS